MTLSDVRNRLLRNTKFRSFAGRVWPFRLIARHQARRLFDLSAGFVYSQVLMCCVELGWFERLADGPRSLADLAADGRLPLAAAARLARAAHALDLTEARAGDAIALGPLGAALVGDAGIAAMAAHHRVLYTDLSDPLALLRGQKRAGLADYWGYTGKDRPSALTEADATPYSELMGASQPMIAEQVLAAFPFQRFQHVLDVGGGNGAFLDALHLRFPSLRRTLFDLPAVVASRRAPAGDLELVPGSFTEDALPEGADLVTLVRIVHDHNDDVVLQLLRAIRKIIPSHGRLVIAEPMAGTPGARAVGDAYFGFYLLAMGAGRARTQPEIDELLRAAGFGQSQRHATAIPLICSVLSACPI
ncbi:MAG: methyltransferase [Pseudomonadota bacterium]